MVVVMHWPASAMPGKAWHPWDKAVHGLAYALLTLLVLLVSERFDAPRAMLPMRMTLRTCLCVLVVVAYGLLDEATQPLTGRSYDLRDWAADSGGAACAALAYLVLRPLFNRAA